MRCYGTLFCGSASSSRPTRSRQRPELGERYLQLGEAFGPKDGVVRECISDDEAALTEHEALERACLRVHDPVLGRADLGIPAQLRNPAYPESRPPASPGSARTH